MKEHQLSRNPIPVAEVVLVCTSAAESNGGTPQGCWLPDLAHPYYIFVDSGCDVTFVSLKGGQVPTYTAGDSAEDPLTKKFMQDKVAAQCLKNSVRLDKIQDLDNYDVFYLAGGTGALVDFPANAALSSLLSRAIQSGKVIAACGLGIAGLLAVPETNIAGRKVACCPDLETVGLGSAAAGTGKSLKELLQSHGLNPVEKEEVVLDANIMTARSCAVADLLVQAVLQAIPKRTIAKPPAGSNC